MTHEAVSTPVAGLRSGGFPIRPIVLALGAFLLLGLHAHALSAPLAPPVADFGWVPSEIYAWEDVAFFSRSTDDSGVILLYAWEIPGEETRLGREDTTTHAFPRRGDHAVSHAVLDATGNWDRTTKTVSVLNSPPVPSFVLDPDPTHRGTPVVLSGSASDRDGDAIVNWTWDLGDGTVAFGHDILHTYFALGSYAVTLTARDEVGAEASVARPVRVVNTPPVTAADFSPRSPIAGEVVTFTAVGVDPDGPSDLLVFTWSFSDGTMFEGAQVSRVFNAGNHTAVVRARDVEGSASAPVVLSISVRAASPP